MAAKKTSRCWPGYEPVPGKKSNSQGSCKPKADSKSTPSEKEFKSKRRKQLNAWQAKHKGKRRQAAEHLHGPEGLPSSQKGAAKKKAIAKKKSTSSAAKRKAPTKNAIARKSGTKKTARTAVRKRAA